MTISRKPLGKLEIILAKAWLLTPVFLCIYLLILSIPKCQYPAVVIIAVLGWLYTRRTNRLIFGAEPFEPRGIRILAIGLAYSAILIIGIPLAVDIVFRFGPESRTHSLVELGWRMQFFAVNSCVYPLLYLLILRWKPTGDVSR